jgi:hypothetical protein
MRPEEHLDTLLTAQLREPDTPAADVPSELASMLDTAALLDHYRHVEPEPNFAQALEQRWLASAELLAAQPSEEGARLLPARLLPARLLPARLLPARLLPARLGLWQAVSRRSSIPRWAPLAAAAVLLLAIGAGMLSAAASAAPGTPLYGLHRVEQGVRAQFAASAVDQGHLHLTYAEQALSDLIAAAAQHNMLAYQDALATLREELDSARAALGQVPAGQAHDALVADLAQVTAQARPALLTALPALDWQERLATTNALGTLGQRIPIITRARIITPDFNVHQAWVISLSGSGFQAGAQVVLDGQVMSGTATITADTVQLTITHALPASPRSIGIQNPNGTAAETTHVMVVGGEPGGDDSPRPTPGGPTPTSTGDTGKYRPGGGEGYATPSAAPTASPVNH